MFQGVLGDWYGSTKECVLKTSLGPLKKLELEGASYVLKGTNREKPFTIQDKA